MAYVNVLEWRSEQVAEWLQGLDDSISPYAHYFINNNVTGEGLLNMTTEDLNKLHVEKIGHQELILEALEHLRNLHHNLDTENFQYICLRLSCKARSLCNEIRMCYPEIALADESKAENGTVGSSSGGKTGAGGNITKQASVSTEVMTAVADVLDSLWTLLSWLDRPPFNNSSNNQQHYSVTFKKSFSDIGLHLATSAQRDTFAENPVRKILDCCTRLDHLSDTLIREVNDALILQPASLDIATVRRRSNALGCGADDAHFGITFEALPLSGVHVIESVLFQSPAHQCDRVHPGDEVVQINYQTVIGWSLKKVCQLMEENPSEMIVTLKKRPRHLPYVIPYMKPIRIPARSGYHNQSKKGSSGRSGGTGGFFNNLPSPRAELLVAPNITLKVSKPKEIHNELRTSVEELDLENITHGTQSDSDSISEDDGTDETFLPSGSNNCASRGQLNGGSMERGGSVTGIGAIGLSPSKSPTQSVRSLLSRPRSTPQRRATISGSSPSLCRPYINISEIWSCHARHIHSEDHNNDEGKRSNTSTLRSNDSGHATMDNGSPNASKANSDFIYYPSSETGGAELRKKGSSASTSSQYKNLKYLPRPMTVGGIPTSLPSPEYINMKDESNTYSASIYSQQSDITPVSSKKAENKMCNNKIDDITVSDQKNGQQCPNLTFEQGEDQSERSFHNVHEQEIKTIQRAPMPKPRTNVPTNVVTSMEVSSSASSKDSTKSVTSPNRKKPIPEPRSTFNSSQVTSPQQRNKLSKENIVKSEQHAMSKSHHLSSSSITQTLKNYLPEVPKPGAIVQPVPTSEFQSFRRCQKSTSVHSSLNRMESNNSTISVESPVSMRQSNKQQPLLQRHSALTSVTSASSLTTTQESKCTPEVKSETTKTTTSSKGKSASHLPEYVNTTPPAVPARNPPNIARKNSSHRITSEEQIPLPRSFAPTSISRKVPPSEILQYSKQPSSRRFSGEYASIHPSELLDGATLGTAMPHVGRRSSAESSGNNFSKEHVKVGRRSSNPFPPPPPSQIISPRQSSTSSSFPYYVSDVYNDEFQETPTVYNTRETGASVNVTSNYPELHASSSNDNVVSQSNSVHSPTKHNTSKTIKDISIPSTPPTQQNKFDMPPQFTPCTYTVHNINHGKSKLSKKDSGKKS